MAKRRTSPGTWIALICFLGLTVGGYFIWRSHVVANETAREEALRKIATLNAGVEYFPPEEDARWYDSLLFIESGHRISAVKSLGNDYSSADVFALCPLFPELETIDVICEDPSVAQLEPIKECSGLKKLRLRGPGLPSYLVDVAGSLTQLEDLALPIGEDFDGDCSPLANCRELKLFVVGMGPNVNDDTMIFAGKNFPKLESLVFLGGDVTGKGIAALAELSNLKQINLERSKLSDDVAAELSKLSTLSELVLAGTETSPDFLKSFKPPESLKLVVVRGASLNEEDIDALKTKRPNLEVIE